MYWLIDAATYRYSQSEHLFKLDIYHEHNLIVKICGMNAGYARRYFSFGVFFSNKVQIAISYEQFIKAILGSILKL